MNNFKSIDATLSVNGKSVKLGTQSLCHILMSFLDLFTDPNILAELANAEDFELRRCVARSENLNAETISLLLQDPSESVVEYLFRSKNATKHLKHEEILYALNRSAYLAEKVANYLGQLRKHNPNVNIEELYSILATHHDCRVRSIIAQDVTTPLAHLQALVMDCDADVTRQARETVANIA